MKDLLAIALEITLYNCNNRYQIFKRLQKIHFIKIDLAKIFNNKLAIMLKKIYNKMKSKICNNNKENQKSVFLL